MKDYKFPHSIIHDFKKDGMKEMYILSDYRIEFVNQMTNDFLDVMHSETATTQRKIMATGKVQQIFNEKFN